MRARTPEVGERICGKGGRKEVPLEVRTIDDVIWRKHAPSAGARELEAPNTTVRPHVCRPRVRGSFHRLSVVGYCDDKLPQVGVV